MLTACFTKKYLFLVVGILLILFLLTNPYKAFAQNTNSPVEPITSENYNSLIHPAYTLGALINGIGCMVEGSSILGSKCPFFVVGSAGQGSQIVPVLADYLPGAGAIGGAQAIMVAMYTNPPARSTEYLADLGKNLGIIKPAYAQVGGSGSSVVSPVFVIWVGIRNIAYILMTVVFLIVGFMLMFRRKLNPQTVISVQNSLPGLIISLLLITFSYFIASLLIDLAFVGSQIVGYFFVTIVGVSGGRTPPSSILNDQNILTIFSEFISSPNLVDISNQTGDIINRFQGMAGILVRLASTLISCGIGQSVTGNFNGIFGIGNLPGLAGCGLASGGGALGPAQVIGLVLYIILLIVLLFAMFRLLFALIGSYVSILFLTISAPFQFLLGSMPGNNKNIENWFRNMLCHVLAFPAVFGAFYLAAFFLGNNRVPIFDITQGAQFGGQLTMPLFGGLGTTFIQTLVAYGILIATPAIPEYICKALTPMNRTEGIIGRRVTGDWRGGQAQTSGLMGTIRGIRPGPRR